ncbi:MAG: radical SAM protein [Candidatus Aminicenantes bacterium]
MNLNNHEIFYEAFKKRAAEMPGDVAVVSRDRFDGIREITNSQLKEEVERLSERLKGEGVKSGDIIGVTTEGNIETVVNVLGIIKAGGIYLPVDPGNSTGRIISQLQDQRAAMLLTGTGEIRKFLFDNVLTPQVVKVKPVVTRCRDQITDMDRLPFPDRSLVDYEKYCQNIGEAMVKYCITMQATRGCPYKCAYCSKIWPKKFVTRSACHLFEEVQAYYDMGIRRFAFYDDIFNLDVENSQRFFRLIIEKGMKLQLFFPVGFRGDILTKDYIDLAVEAGTVNIAMALETASPRLQKLIRKNLNLEKFRENITYLSETYPHVILCLQMMHGFPSETEEEARMTLDFLKSIKWVDFPYIHVLKIHSNTDMEQIALESGIPREAIEKSRSLAYHELPDTLPFDKNFTISFKAEFLNDYFLLKERLLQVLPQQLKVMTRDEIVQKYHSYLPTDIKSFSDLLEVIGIKEEELGIRDYLDEANVVVPNLNEKIKKYYPEKTCDDDALRILLLDLTQFFTSESDILYDLVEPPLGLTVLLTYINQQLGSKVRGKLAKSRIDFDSYEELKELMEEFKPEMIGIRTLTFYKDFFHKTAALIRQWGITAPIIGGGPYSTAEYMTVLQDRNIDLAVLGEGELTFYQLIREFMKNDKKLPSEEILKEIPGLAFIPESEKTQEKSALETGKLNESIEKILKEIAEAKTLNLAEMNRISEDEKKQIFDFNVEGGGDYDF